ncbi:MAG: hypothetical protein LAO06_16650 [Acidobacteriia bacterium]|nr:hypothetical protein [Terriglobia bacterium]
MASFLERERVDMKGRWARMMVLLTCLVMVLVVAQQGGTIDKQHNLIQLLWGDSKQLTKIRTQELAKQREKIYTTDPHYGTPAPKAPADTPKAPDSEAAPEPKADPAPPAKSAPSTLPGKSPRELWRI